ncbi:MAG: serine protease [Oligoflexales bacterium]
MKKLLLLMIFLFSCGKSQNPSDLSRIIGDNDLEQVVMGSDNVTLVRAIGRMRLGCTVTHIGGGIGITAGHCFSRSFFEGIQRNKPCNVERFNMVWGLVKGNETPLVGKCEEIIAFEYSQLRDYAFVRVDPAPEAYLQLSLALPQVGDPISIYSHPRKRPLEWSNYCYVDYVYRDQMDGLIAYRCDTEIGSSGAPIVNELQEIIGIHTFYDDEIDRNGGMPLALLPSLNTIL